MLQVQLPSLDWRMREAGLRVGWCAVFRSAPDIWAIDQLFPIMPLHRLDEEPTESATLADITCDSDGKIDRFPSPGFPPLAALQSAFAILLLAFNRTAVFTPPFPQGRKASVLF